MKKLLYSLLALTVVGLPKMSSAASIYDFSLPLVDGKNTALSSYKGKVVLVVNVASKCGNTPQYKTLQDMYTKYQSKGLVILGFPANNFGAQEPGTDSEISEFCKKNYGVTFPIFSKLSVKGSDQAPLYSYLTSSNSNPKFSGPIKWNFEKFLIGKNGEILGRFAPGEKPNADPIIQAIEAAL
jgi:glutathione peroxidase